MCGVTGCAIGEPDNADVASTTTLANTIAAPTVRTRVVARVSEPVALVERSADDSFAYIVSRKGTVYKWFYDDTPLLIALDMTSLTSPGGERGLLGLAFRDDRAYVNYTNIDGDTVIAEYAVSTDGTFDAASRRELLKIDQPYANHNGGAIMTGPDNMLYIAMGDGGLANDPGRVAQDLSSLLGKVLRIDPTPSADAAYTVPSDNPYIGVADARPEIWALGLRNPWRFSFDEDGNLWIADVGQGKWEEIDFSERSGDNAGKGDNFGWSAYEGTHRFNDDQTATPHHPPIHEYEHTDGRCSVSGGVRVWSKSPLAALRGRYLFGDYCSGKVTALTLDNGTVRADVVAEDLGDLVAVQQTSRGVYALDIGGVVYELVSDR